MSVEDNLGSSEINQQDEIIDVDPDTEVMPVTYEITSYGADYTVDGLVKRLDNSDIFVPSFDPEFVGTGEVRGFQRRFVWGRPQMDRFIESLLLGLPVPGIFLVRDKDNRLLVLDGQQRLLTLQQFFSGFIGDTRYRLRFVQEPFVGKSYEELEPEDRRRLDDSVIHSTVLRQDHPQGSQDAVYSIFERLNTGGSPLQPQEIRVALFSGKFLRGISELNSDSNWRSLYGPPSKRYKDQELILRILAMHETPQDYSRPVKGFLNQYLANNRERDLSPGTELGQRFVTAVSCLAEAVGPSTYRPSGQLNAAVVDAVTVGLMNRLTSGPLSDLEALSSAYENLITDKTFTDAVSSSTATEDAVKARLQAATDRFAPVG